MEKLTRFYLLLCHRAAGLRKGQTMTEYSLMLAAVAVAVFSTFKTMGNDVGSLINKINTDLTSAS